MKFTAKQIAEILNGKILGNPESAVNSLAKIEDNLWSFLCNNPTCQGLDFPKYIGVNE